MAIPIRRRVITVSKKFSQFANAIGVLCFLVVFIGFIIQIFYRYVLNDPIRWTEEMIMIGFIWSVFWANAFMVPINQHVSLDVVYDIASAKVKRVLAIISMAAVIIAFITLFPATIDYLDFLTRKKSPVLRLPMHWIYACYLLFIVGFTVQAGMRLLRLTSSNWRKNLS